MNWGRGFSIPEISDVGLSTSMARELGIMVDHRRKTKHYENVEQLKDLLECEKAKKDYERNLR
ncbi:ribosomal protein L13e [Candidatus Bathyarchaeota archaeon]|nr:ribosomal protein L13e [Candidatus Bathyarchaeota archaeon]MBS7628653.1 ribosomal protein L13e [Candidatus Bathyarchaeota archaeon]